MLPNKAAPLPIQLPINGPGKTTENDPRVWASVPTRRSGRSSMHNTDHCSHLGSELQENISLIVCFPPSFCICAFQINKNNSFKNASTVIDIEYYKSSEALTKVLCRESNMTQGIVLDARVSG